MFKNIFRWGREQSKKSTEVPLTENLRAGEKVKLLQTSDEIQRLLSEIGASTVHITDSTTRTQFEKLRDAINLYNILLEDLPKLEGAPLAIEPITAHVQALIGAIEYEGAITLRYIPEERRLKLTVPSDMRALFETHRANLAEAVTD
jgi:hypothetical protein